MRDVSYFKKQYEKKGVEFLAIHAFAERKEADAYIAESKTEYRWMFADDDALAALGVTGVPTQIVLDREGRVAWKSSLSTFREGPGTIQAALDRALAN
jgi:hypothetical protein